MLDLIIKNALVVDGSGNKPFLGTVCIKNGIIKGILSQYSTTLNAHTTVDAQNLILAPGFIDIHGHSDISIIAAPEATGKIAQGVTTEICGNCGLSLFPITDYNREHLQSLFSHYNITLEWATLTQYAAYVNKVKPAINIISLCGHNTLRAAVAGYEKKELDPCELRKMKELHIEALQQGAGGTSTGLLYVPGCFADFTELLSLGKITSNFSKIFTSHLRSEGKNLLEAIDEFVKIAEATGMKHIHISHLKTAGKANWHKLAPALLRISQAAEKNIKITADRYPYTESMTQLSAYMPSPYSEMDDVKLQEFLKSPDNFAQFLNNLNSYFTDDDWKNKRLVSTNSSMIPPALLGKTLSELSAKLAKPASLICAELLRDNAPGTMGASKGMSDKNMLKIMQQPFVCCATDESARPEDYSIGRSHPRGFGSFPEFIKRLSPLMPIETIVAKMTSLPASIFNIPQRGLIKEGYLADMVLINPAKIANSTTANFANPHKLNDLIEKVWVNGTIAYSDNKISPERSGHFIKL